jgi:DNA-binding transcriptional MerR regulator
MSKQENQIEKTYYTIGEVAKMLGLTTAVIRSWENEFDILKTKRNTRGDRYFTAPDIEKLKLIYHLVREKGYTMDGARLRLKVEPDVHQRKVQIIEKLKNVRGFLEELRKHVR